MAIPKRNCSPGQIVSSSRTFFVTTKTIDGRKLLQSERNAGLMIDVLRSYAAEGKFRIHDFVVMPNHLHVLMTVGGDMSIERAMQLIKGRFSFRLKKEFGCLGEVWQRGFSETRIEEARSFARHREYIAANPVREGLVRSAEEFPYCFAYLAREKAQGLKPRSLEAPDGTTKVVP
jgi:putative transposase